MAGRPGRELLDAVLRKLQDAGCDIELAETAKRGDAHDFAAQAKGLDCVAVAGGDGTLNEVINGLKTQTDPPPVALIPVGTSNVMAAEIGLGNDPARIAQAILGGNAVSVSLGQVNGHYFSVMAGAGFDAHLIANVSTLWKRRIGPAAFVASFFRQLRSFDYPAYSLTIDGVMAEAGSVVISNAKRYASSWILAPSAAITSPDLHIRHIARRSGWASKMGAVKLLGGRLGTGRDLTMQSGRAVTIDGPPGDPVQADGDIVATLPATICVVPQALQLLFPT